MDMELESVIKMSCLVLIPVTMRELKITSYNCRGLPSTRRRLALRPDIMAIFDSDSDIVCLQETWMAKQDLASLNNLHESYYGVGSSVADLSNGLVQGHHSGGVAILYKQGLQSLVRPLNLDLDWCTGIEISIGDKKCVMLCIYLPYQCSKNQDEYLEKLGCLEALIEEVETSCFTILGDWNADICNLNNSLFAGHMKRFCESNELSISSIAIMPDTTYTFVSAAWGTQSWLDHAVSSADFHNAIIGMSVQYELSDEDHIPWNLTLDVHCMPALLTDVHSILNQPRIKWEAVTNEGCKRYSSILDQKLRNIAIPAAVHCRNPNCKDAEHGRTLRMSMMKLSLVSNPLVIRFTIVPKVKALRVSLAGTSMFQIYTKLRGIYVDYGLILANPGMDRCLRFIGKQRPGVGTPGQIKRHEDALRRDSLANKLADTDPKSFWKELRSVNGNNSSLPTIIDGTSGVEAIAEQ